MAAAAAATAPQFYMDEKWKLSKKGSSRDGGFTRSSSHGRSSFTRKCASLVKEQRARFYIMRRCVTMLVCWRDFAGVFFPIWLLIEATRDAALLSFLTSKPKPINSTPPFIAIFSKVAVSLRTSRLPKWEKLVHSSVRAGWNSQQRLGRPALQSAAAGYFGFATFRALSQRDLVVKIADEKTSLALATPVTSSCRLIAGAEMAEMPLTLRILIQSSG
ncbi:hypothetical protein ACLOJK_012757 [Asimina triloba]